ncbi:MAG: hypothetical protein RBU37_01500 [Myxococcota bacterium]|nr:hypothetical protein [Myxococcota bacterium]
MHHRLLLLGDFTGRANHRQVGGTGQVPNLQEVGGIGPSAQWTRSVVWSTPRQPKKERSTARNESSAFQRNAEQA